MVALAAHLPQIRYLPIGEALAVRLRAVQESGDTGSREESVEFGLERGKLFAANVRATTRHHHSGVPAQERQGSAKGMEPLELLLELFVRGR
jgi:hypothetical protein